MPIAKEEREAFFREHFAELAKNYNITKIRRSQALDYERVAYLCSLLMIKMYSWEIGQDAAYRFYQWALKRKLRCDEVREVEYAKGEKLATPFHIPNRPIYDNLDFAKWTRTADDILSPLRSPIVRRCPVFALD